MKRGLVLRADLHLHTCFSPDSLTPLEALVGRCMKVGLTCIAVTDHNTIQGALQLKLRAPFQVIIGEEIRTAGGDIIGLFLQEAVPPGLPLLEAVQRLKAQGGLLSIPHPYDRVRSSVIRPDALAQALPYADMVETFNARNSGKADEQAARLASQRGLPGCAVSDAHTLGELGGTYVMMPEYDGTPQGFLAALRQGDMVFRRASPLVHLASSYARVRRRFFWRTP